MTKIVQSCPHLPYAFFLSRMNQDTRNYFNDCGNLFLMHFDQLNNIFNTFGTFLVAHISNKLKNNKKLYTCLGAIFFSADVVESFSTSDTFQ